MADEHPGTRLRRFRQELDISQREAARQLHVKHPSLREWEAGEQTPTHPYREAIEVWTNGAVRACDWPLSGRELEIVTNAKKVGPVCIAPATAESAADSGTDISSDAATREAG
jgi:transcriptional regulator with XRE-family HTH domain